MRSDAVPHNARPLLAYMASASIPRLVPVYRLNQPAGTKPLCFLGLEQAREWVAEGIARWIKGKYLRLLSERLPRLRGMSCCITERVIIKALSGSKYHQSLIDGWENVTKK